MDKISIRTFDFSDLERIRDFLALGGLDIGAHILKLCFENSEHESILGTNEAGEIVFFDSLNRLPYFVDGRNVLMGFVMHTREEYQGRGFLKRYLQLHNERKYFPAISNSTSDSVLKLRISPTVNDAKILLYTGRPTKDLQVGFLKKYGADISADDCIKIEELHTESNFEKLLAYDRSVLNLNRAGFTTAWSENSNDPDKFAVTLTATTADGNIVGFVTLRRHTYYYALMPLYADDRSIAYHLLRGILSIYFERCDTNLVWDLFFDAKNYLMLSFVKHFRFDIDSALVRQYYSGAEKIRETICMDKVYTMHEYWPA